MELASSSARPTPASASPARAVDGGPVACRAKRMGLQRSAFAPGPAVAPSIVHDVLRSSGTPLDASVRAEMEPRFRHGFADVRVHADGRAAESARAVGARAYAVGRDVVFGAGRYAPGSVDGKRLIAHELAHVVQQRGASVSIQPQLEIGAADDPAEREADAAASAVARGASVPPSVAGAAAALRRDGEEDGRGLPNPARESRRRGPVDPIDMDENTPYLFFRFGEGGRFELILRAPGTPVGATGLGVRYQRRRGFAPIASADPLELEDTYSPQDIRAVLPEFGEQPEVEGAASRRIPLPGDDDVAMRVLTERMSRALRAILQQQQQATRRFQLQPPMTGTPGLPQPPRLGLGLPPLRLGLPAGFEPTSALPPPPHYRLRLRTPGWTPEPSPSSSVPEARPEATPEGPVAPAALRSVGGGYNIFRSAAGPAPAVAPPIVHDVLRSSGAPLDASVRAEMEPRFRHSFADVRVHVDGRAAESAHAIGAHAYAVGRDVVFGAGRYAPGSMDGRRLIAHELAHVVQQRGASASIQPKLEIGPANDPAEREADAAAERVAAKGEEAGSISRGVAPRLRRQGAPRPWDPTWTPPAGGGMVIVQPGDTLAGIAGTLYGNPAGWGCLLRANRATLGDPPELREGALLEVPHCDPPAAGSVPATLPAAATQVARPASAVPANSQEMAGELLRAEQEGRMSTSSRERGMLAQMRSTGTASRGAGAPAVALSPGMITLLHTLQDRAPVPAAGGRAEFSLLSLVRGGGRHARGEAVDIDRYGGHPINIRDAGEAVAGVLAVIAALPAGCYALGLPRVPRTDPAGAAADAQLYPGFYEGRPPQLRAAYASLPSSVPFLPVASQSDINHSPTGRVEGDLRHIADAGVQAQLRTAIGAARTRGAQIQYLFPDALDHLHVQVMPC